MFCQDWGLRKRCLPRQIFRNPQDKKIAAGGGGGRAQRALAGAAGAPARGAKRRRRQMGRAADEPQVETLLRSSFSLPDSNLALFEVFLSYYGL